MKFVIAFLLMISQAAFAGFGGSRSSFSGGSRSSFSGSRSSFSSSRSYSSGSSFGGSRSSSTATVTRPSSSSGSWFGSRPSQPAPTTVREIHYNNGGGTGNGFVNGMLVGHMLSNNPSVIVNGGAPAQVVAAPTAQPGVIVAQETHGFFYYFFAFVLWGALIAAVIWGIRKVFFT